MLSENPSSTPTETSTPVEVPQRNEDNTVRLENVNHLASLAYKIALAIGTIVVFSYLFSIHFFPSALAPGEVILFVFIALAFSVIYGVFWMYGTVSALWVLQLAIWLWQKSRFRRKKLSAFRPWRYIQEIAALPTSRWWPRLRWNARMLERLHDAVLTVRGAGVPRSMLVLVLVLGGGQNAAAPDDKDGHQLVQQAQLRARGVANAIRQLLPDDNIKIVPEGRLHAENQAVRRLAGPCTADVRMPSSDWQRCEMPIFNVALHVKYAAARVDELR